MKASHANCTPATDGEHVVAFFGSEGLYCYDFAGELKWQVDFGRLHSGPTPIIVGDLHYTCGDRGVLTVRETKTGKEVYKRRVSSGGSNNFTASAVATKDHLYFSAESGNVVVIKTGREYESVATNKMDAILMATPAIAGNQLFIRTEEHLFCIASDPESTDEESSTVPNRDSQEPVR